MWHCPTKQNQISKHGMFPLVHVRMRQWGAWELCPYNSIAQMFSIYPIFAHLAQSLEYFSN